MEKVLIGCNNLRSRLAKWHLIDSLKDIGKRAFFSSLNSQNNSEELSPQLGFSVLCSAFSVSRTFTSSSHCYWTFGMMYGTSWCSLMGDPDAALLRGMFHYSTHRWMLSNNKVFHPRFIFFSSYCILYHFQSDKIAMTPGTRHLLI